MAIDPSSRPMNLEGKVALVTGAGSGIGRAISRRFAALGARVLVTDVNEAGGAEAVQTIVAAGGTASFFRCDVTLFDDAKAAVAAARDTFGQIDVLVNNAGWDVIEPFVKNHPEHWYKVIDINLKGQIHMCRAAMDAFMEQGSGGKIVNLSSDSGRVGSLGEAVYSACKGGVIALTKTLAREGARYQIMVNAVSPGITDTPFVASLDPKVIEAIVKSTPMRRMADPDEPAEMVAFLASDSNTFMTGQVVSVSGGLTMV
ncbi:MAG: SDR family NAD(P)-dependent oxidoreductase [Thermoleophilia bacterium]